MVSIVFFFSFLFSFSFSFFFSSFLCVFDANPGALEPDPSLGPPQDTRSKSMRK